MPSDTPPNNPWANPTPSIENPWQERGGQALTQGDEGIVPIEPGRVDALDFWDAIKQNRRNTYILIFSMLLLSACFGYVLGWAWDTATGRLLGLAMSHRPNQVIPWSEIILTPSKSGMIVGSSLLGAMVIWSLFALTRADKMVLAMAGAREVSYNEHPQLHNVVEEMAIAAGLPKPKVYLMETEMPNAFATGLRPEKAAVGITTGLLHTLDRRELQGVIAHEMGHILNDDMRYATVMTIMTGVLIFVAQMVLNMRHLFAYRSSSDGRGRGGHPFIAIIMIVVFIMTAILVPILARVIQMAISRQREYLADATAVKLTRDPPGLIAALQKIAGSNQPALRPNTALEPLFIVSPSQMWQNGHRAWLSTHPSIENRVERLKALE